MFLNRGRQESRIFEVSNRNGEGVASGSVADVVYEIEGAQIEDMWAISSEEVAMKIVGCGMAVMDIRNRNVKEWVPIEGGVKDIRRVDES